MGLSRIDAEWLWRLTRHVLRNGNSLNHFPLGTPSHLANAVVFPSLLEVDNDV